MKCWQSLLIALLLACASFAHAQATEQVGQVNQGDYIRALAEMDRLDKAGQLNALMEKIMQPRSSSELKAYADWLKARIMHTDTREPLFYWGYSHLLRMASINDSAALMFATAALMLQSETARCADITATSGKRHIDLLMRSELHGNYWAQSPEVRRQATQFALREEARKRSGPATLWVCEGGMEEITAAMKASAPESAAASPRGGSNVAMVPSTFRHRLLPDPEFDEHRKRIRVEFDRYFSNDQNRR